MLYIPANILPIMETSSLFGAQRDTIMSGVVFLWKTGIVAPRADRVHRQRAGAAAQDARHRPAADLGAAALDLAAGAAHGSTASWSWIGRWSILDIYVVALLAALVQLRGFASIAAGPGAIAFGAVVVLTMLSAMAFDPRLIWDPGE